MSIEKYIFEFIKENKLWFFKDIITIALNSPLEILGIGYFTTKILNGISTESNDFLFKNITYLILLNILIDSAFAYADKLNNSKIPELEDYVRGKLITSLFEKNKKNFEDIKSGEYIQNLIKVSNISSTIFTYLNYNIIPFVLLTIIVTIRLSTINTKISIVFLLFMLLYVVFFYIMIKNNSKKAYDRSVGTSKYYDTIDDLLINAKTIITTGNLKNELNDLKKNNMEFNTIQADEYNLLTKLKYGVSIINITLFGSVMYTVLNLKKNNIIDNNSMISLITIFILLSGRLKYLSRRLCETVSINGSLQDANEIIKQLHHDTIKNGMITNQITNGNIKVSGLNFSYDNNNLLNNINFSVRKNLPLLISGQSGVGKSTLIQIMLGLIPYNTGSILYDMVELKNTNIDYMRMNISYVPQNPTLFNRTILENIAYSTKLSKDEVYNIIINEPIYDIIKKLDINMVIGKYGSKLSGGMKQVVVLLREYLSDKPIIFLDEPTSSIDKDYLVHGINLIKKMATVKTVIIISHQSEVKRHFNNILNL
jgi:ATP-binding cassette subfamily B protein